MGTKICPTTLVEGGKQDYFLFLLQLEGYQITKQMNNGWQDLFMADFVFKKICSKPNNRIFLFKFAPPNIYEYERENNPIHKPTTGA
ncbi:hypothetical protein [Bacteroides sp. 519]|uniref:hypothetical protein n=1 Tax=Bacteroides sp. 519 TaxID=2302937 RepID=UPI0019402CD6|nr:hypothetical protein [Bacteroides sp. 519]NDV59126.1 hypothetical protein [Bacteroides sp. 519]